MPIEATEHIILAKTLSAGNSSQFVVKTNNPKTVYLFPVADLTAGENANLQRKDPDGTWQDVYDHSFKGAGGQVILDSTVTGVTVVGEGVYRIELENPTNSIGVAVSDQSNA